jgi:hypothetical protein
MRSSRFICSAITAAVALITITACKADAVTATPYSECSTEPGCQPQQAVVAPEVGQSLDDINSRALVGLPTTARNTISANLDALSFALSKRDITHGRLALNAALDAIAEAERTCSACMPDLGAIRLGLAPAARSLGLDPGVIDPPAR